MFRLLQQASRASRSRLFSSSHNRYVRFSQPTSSSLDVRVKLGATFFAFGTVYYVAHLEQVPETGRWRFMNTTERFEAQFQKQAKEEAREEFKDTALPLNHPLTRHVRRVVSQILSSSNLGVISGGRPAIVASPVDSDDGFWNPDSHFGVENVNSTPVKEWDVIVVNNPKIVNAQALPGVVIIYTGLLPVCQDEQGLAAVLAHEIGHVLARHSAEKISSGTVLFGLTTLLHFLGLSDFASTGWLQTFILEYPNSRAQEREADAIGLRLMSNACFDPKAALDMFGRLGKVEAKAGMKIPDFLSTHPSSANRITHLEEKLPEAYAILAANPSCASTQEQLHRFQEAFAARPSSADAGEVFWKDN